MNPRGVAIEAPRRRKVSIAFVLLVLLIPAEPGVARASTLKPPVSPDRIEAVPASTVLHVDVAPPGCSVGVPGPARFLIDAIQPPNDAYFVRVRPTSCAACAGAPGVWISTVSFALEFRASCSQPFEVAVVGTSGDTTCALPNTFRILRGPVAVTPPPSSLGINNFTVPLGGRVPLLGDAYLRLTFTQDGAGCTADGTRPRLVTTAACSLCVAWNYYPADTLDLCAALYPGNPIVYSVVDSCISSSLAGIPEPVRVLEAISVRPNPTRFASDVRFVLEERADVHVTIHDVAGRRIGDLVHTSLESGEHTARWDGRDAEGHDVGAGAYFAVVRANGHAMTRRIIVVR
jgi:hypothetical protein